MKIEVRRLGYEDGKRVRTSTTRLLIIPENEDESALLDDVLGSQIPTPLVGEVQLSDGYGDHYVWVENRRDFNTRRRNR